MAYQCFNNVYWKLISELSNGNTTNILIHKLMYVNVDNSMRRRRLRLLSLFIISIIKKYLIMQKDSFKSVKIYESLFNEFTRPTTRR